LIDLLTGAALLALAKPEPQPVAEAPEEAGEEIVVQATRSNRRVQDEPVRVEVVTREEIEEKALMRPGNIAMLVNETGGVRVQVTSPGLGAANIRIQGLDGRYTQLLADGLPLYGPSSSLGLLQIPPTDLGQVEVIKGAASALYGASALGGVINLVSRRPSDSPEAEALINVTTRNGQDLAGYTSAPLGPEIGASLTGGLHRQSQQDIDGDGWADMAGYERWSLRPRLFWRGAGGGKLYATIGAMQEDRRGGTLPGEVAPDGRPFALDQDTHRLDAGLTAELPIASFGTAHIRASAMDQHHRHRFGEVVERDRHRTGFAEASLAGTVDGTAWVAGVALQADDYRSRTFPAFNYRFTAPGVFAQVEQEIGTRLTLAASGRVDFHNAYGTQVSPRVSALYRTGPWRLRVSAGRGFTAPTPFVDEVEDAGLSRLEPLGKLKPETARTASVDLGYAKGPIEAGVTLFAADIDNAVRLIDTGPASVRLINQEGRTRVRGSELLLRYKLGAVTLTGSYVFVSAIEPQDDCAGRWRVPLTPRHTGGLVAMWEDEERGRLGFEAYHTGRQRLDDNPYRSVSKSYVHLGLLGELVVGRARLFANAENLLNVRQTRFDPLLRSMRAPSGSWTTDVWTPTEGFTLNTGVRLRFGEE
jgi:outer membrane receptor for ferrienterochelin and colicins